MAWLARANVNETLAQGYDNKVTPPGSKPGLPDPETDVLTTWLSPLLYPPF